MTGERRLRVVYLDHVARLSGGEIALLRLLAALKEHVDAHVILGEDGPLAARLHTMGVAVEVIPLASPIRDLRKERLRPFRFDPRLLTPLPRYVSRLARTLKALQPDVVHTNSLKAALYGGVAGRLARVPVVWHVRDRIDDDYLPRPAVRLVRLAAEILPTAVVANSQATLATLPRRQQGSVVYNAVVPDPVEQTAAHEQRIRTELTVGIVGRLAPWKGQDVFLESFAAAFRGSDVRGRVIGSALFGEDEYARSLRRRVEELGISTQIEFRGFREDIWSELADLDVLVHSSVTPEPFGQVVLEGMAAGLPVVATNAGGPAELITDGVDGLLVPTANAPALASALERLRDDRELRRRLGAAARERSRDFTPERTAARMLEIYAAVAR